jgi:ATP-dependent Clp protease ATP-binding subunit ClpA
MTKYINIQAKKIEEIDKINNSGTLDGITFYEEKKDEEKAMEDFGKAAENIKNNLTDYFSPEFINRIDKIVIFNPLDKNQIKKIITL